MANQQFATAGINVSPKFLSHLSNVRCTGISRITYLKREIGRAHV